MLIFATDSKTYEKALYLLSMKLSDLGLKINQKKINKINNKISKLCKFKLINWMNK